MADLDAETTRLVSRVASTLEASETLTSTRPELLAGTAGRVAAEPWTLRARHLEDALAAGIDEAAVVRAIARAAFVESRRRGNPPQAAPQPQPLPRPAPPDWPFPERAPLSLAILPDTAAAAAAWRAHMLDRDAPLSRARRGLVMRTVAEQLGDLDGVRQHVVAPRDALDVAITAYAELATRAPWRLGAAAEGPLRDAGLDDAGLADLIATVAYATFASRTAVALSALGRP